MGAGKSHVGCRLARVLHLEHIDLDYLLEKECMLSAKDIFKKYGENRFRSLERNILLSTPSQGVISTGGGAILSQANREFLSDKLVIWLNPDWNNLYNRIKNSKRPLVLRNSKDTLYQIYKDRIALYREVTNIEINQSDMDDVIDEILKKIIDLTGSSNELR